MTCGPRTPSNVVIPRIVLSATGLGPRTLEQRHFWQKVKWPRNEVHGLAPLDLVTMDGASGICDCCTSGDGENSHCHTRTSNLRSGNQTKRAGPSLLLCPAPIRLPLPSQRTFIELHEVHTQQCRCTHMNSLVPSPEARHGLLAVITPKNC